MASGYINIPDYGSPSWRDPVTTAVNLPTNGNQPGDARVTLDTDSIYIWSETSWVLASGGGAGSVTSVSVVTANGVNGTVANPATTPAITLTLGNITPTSVAASGTVTGSNLSGTNTGNQTITLTGDVAGSGTGSFSTTIQPNVVTNAKLAQMPSNTIKGNNTGGAANALDLTVSQVNTMLGDILANGTVAFTASQSLGGFNITNSADPTTAQMLATKNYVDMSVAALQPQASVYAATAGSNISGTYLNGVAGVGATFTTTSTAAFTLDGTTPPLNSRILIKDQSSGFQNGIYALTTVAVPGVSGTVFTRSLDYNTAADMNSAGLIPIINGTVNALSSWQQVAFITTVGTDSLVFTEFTANPSLYLLKANNLSDVASKSAAFNNLSPMTTLGDIIYGGTSGTGTRLGVGSTGQVLTIVAGVPAWGAAAVTAMGAFGSSPNTNAATITGSTLVLQPASGSFPGGVSTTTQTFAGVKTFSSAPNFSSLTASSVLLLDGSGNVTSTTGLSNSLLATMPNNTIKSNVSGGSAAPSDNTFASLAATAVTISSNANAKGVANTFALSDHTHELTAGAAVLDSVAQYDGSNWQAIYPESLLAPSRAVYLSDEFMGFGDLSAGSGLIGDLMWSPSFNGTGATITQIPPVLSNHPGIIQLATGTSTTAVSGIGLGLNINATGTILLGGGAVTVEGDVLIPTLGVTAQQYVFTFGLVDSISAFTTIANGVYFSYSNGAGGDFFNINTTAASVTTKTTTTTAVAANTWYKLTMVINAAATSVSFFINGVSAGAAVTTNIPTAAAIRPAFFIVKSAGTASRTAQVDYFMLNQRFTTPR